MSYSQNYLIVNIKLSHVLSIALSVSTEKYSTLKNVIYLLMIVKFICLTQISILRSYIQFFTLHGQLNVSEMLHD